MDFLPAGELHGSSRDIWQRLSRDGKMVITDNGKPAALLLDISGDDLEETLSTLQQIKTLRLFNRMRAEAGRRGFLPEEAIEAEIQAARADMNARGEAV